MSTKPCVDSHHANHRGLKSVPNGLDKMNLKTNIMNKMIVSTRNNSVNVDSG